MTELTIMRHHLANAASSSGTWSGRVKLTEMATVGKPFRCDGKLMKVGDVMSPDQISALRRDNRDALINGGFIRILPLSAEIGAIGS
jgi:hypothetical protein